jgi:hypothetical protein
VSLSLASAVAHRHRRYTFQLYLLLLVVQAAVDMAAQRPIPTPTVEKFQKLIPLYLIFTCSLPLFALLLYHRSINTGTY